MPALWLFLLTTPSFSQGPTEEQALISSQVERLRAVVIQLQAQLSTVSSFLEGWTQQSVQLDPSSEGYSTIRTSQGYRLLVDVVNIEPYADGQKLTLKIGNPHAMSFQGFQLSIEHGPRGAGKAAHREDLDTNDALAAVMALAQSLEEFNDRTNRLLAVFRQEHERKEQNENMIQGHKDSPQGVATPQYRPRERSPFAKSAIAEIQREEARRQQLRKQLKTKSESFTQTLNPGSWTKVAIVLAPASREDLAYIRLTSVVTNEVGLLRAAP